MPCRVSRREFEWCLGAARDKRDFAAADEVLRIRSRDGRFDVAVAVQRHGAGAQLGPLLVLGAEFPLLARVRPRQRIGLPGSGFVPHGVIHTALVQSIIQRCFSSRRRVKPVDAFGLPVGLADRLADRVADLCTRPVRELEPPGRPPG